MLGIHDRNEVLARGRHVEELLRPEVLDDVGPSADGGRSGTAFADPGELVAPEG